MVLDAVKIEANGQVIADLVTAKMVNCCCISPTRTPTSGNLRTEQLRHWLRCSVEQVQVQFLSYDRFEETMGVAAAQELSNFKVNVEVAGSTTTSRT